MMYAQDKQHVPDRVELKGILSEFRDALEEEIDKIKKSGQSSTLLFGGRQIESHGADLWYRFNVEYVPSLPADTPCKLVIGKAQFDVTVISYEENSIVISTKTTLPDTIGKARLENGATVLMERLIKCIEENAEKENPAGKRMLSSDCGVYPVKKIFEYDDLALNTGNTQSQNNAMEVEVFDEELGRTIEKIIDPSGKELFKSIYSSIYTWHDPYEVVIRDKDGARHGLIDKEGNEILPCIYDVPWNGFYHEQQRICFVENGKQGMKDYDGNIIIPAIYHEIHGRKDPYLTVRVGEKDSYKEGLITYDGKTVIEANHSRIGWCSDHKHFFCCADGRCEMYVVEDCAAMP